MKRLLVKQCGAINIIVTLHFSFDRTTCKNYISGDNPYNYQDTKIFHETSRGCQFHSSTKKRYLDFIIYMSEDNFALVTRKRIKMNDSVVFIPVAVYTKKTLYTRA